MTIPIDTIVCGDCLEVMKQIDDYSIDLILCDLPYQITSCSWDSIIPFVPLWERYKRICKTNGVVVLTASQPFTSLLITSNPRMFKYVWVWDKKMPTGHLNAKKKPLSRHEDIVIFSESKLGNFCYNPIMRVGKYRDKSPDRKANNYEGRVYNKVIHRGSNFNDQYYPTSILEMSNANQRNKQHPTQKPVALFEYLIKTYTNEGDLVLDNCIGSGTTAVAALNTNRHFIGIELSEEYCEIARKRIAEIKPKQNSGEWW